MNYKQYSKKSRLPPLFFLHMPRSSLLHLPRSFLNVIHVIRWALLKFKVRSFAVFRGKRIVNSKLVVFEMASLREFLHILYQWQWLPLLTVLFIIYITYYLFHVVQKPRLIGKDGRFREFILQSCPIVSEHYWPTIWCFGARAQTVIRALIRSRPSVPFRR